MKFNPIKNNAGLTLVEITIAACLLCMVLVCTMVLLNSTLSLWAKGASGTGSNSNACIAARKLVQNIEEGQSASLVGDNLVVSFPYYDAGTGDYVRTSPGVTATFYLSGPTGSETSGSYLWKSVGGVKTRLAKNVLSLTFPPIPLNSTLVQFSLTGQDEAGGTVTPNLIQQSVKLRNG